MTRRAGGRYEADKDTGKTTLVEKPTASDPRGDRPRDARGNALTRTEPPLKKTKGAAQADRAAPRTDAAGGTASSPVASSKVAASSKPAKAKTKSAEPRT